MRKLLLCTTPLPKQFHFPASDFPDTGVESRYEPFTNLLSHDRPDWVKSLLNHLATCTFHDKAAKFLLQDTANYQMLVSSKTRVWGVNDLRFRLSVPMHVDPNHAITIGVVHAGEASFGLSCWTKAVSQITLKRGVIFAFDSRYPHDFTPTSKKVDMTLIDLKSLKTKLTNEEECK